MGLEDEARRAKREAEDQKRATEEATRAEFIRSGEEKLRKGVTEWSARLAVSSVSVGDITYSPRHWLSMADYPRLAYVEAYLLCDGIKMCARLYEYLSERSTGWDPEIKVHLVGDPHKGWIGNLASLGEAIERRDQAAQHPYGSARSTRRRNTMGIPSPYEPAESKRRSAYIAIVAIIICLVVIAVLYILSGSN